MPYWYGVTRREVSVDDDARGPPIAAAFCEGETGFGRAVRARRRLER